MAERSHWATRRCCSFTGVDTIQTAADAAAFYAAGETVMFLAVDGRFAGLVGVADPIKPTTRQAISELRTAGLHIVVVTGDNAATAAAVARQVGIDDVRAEVLPADKYRQIRMLQEAGHLVAMAGDGINDAPALAQANVGIAMGTGTDIAMNSARIVLVKGDLTAICRARRLRRDTMRNIRQNLFFAFVYNFIGVPVAAGVLYPALGIVANPMLASAAMALSSVSVIGNALRLRTPKRAHEEDAPGSSTRPSANASSLIGDSVSAAQAADSSSSSDTIACHWLGHRL